ncbi:MAG TPA: LysR substrate-binding domain-containing protein [Stellaceae bacterium]|nr:LysR substrate-binding domain-containing protein [Stellaceae bacterium]
MMPLPSLQQLRFLCALAEHRHFGRAAEACAVTQSTLSAGLKELEERLGVPLVERSHRRALFTPVGEEIVARGRRLLREAQDLTEAARSGREPLAGPLRLGVIPTIGPYLLPAAMRGLAKRFPKLKLYLREEQTAPLLAKLEAGEIDLALIALPYATGELEVMTLGEDPLLVALPKTHPLVREKRVSRADLAGEALLLMEDGHCLRSHALEACRLAAPDRNEVFQGTSLKTLLQMAAGGIGITLVPAIAAPSEISPGSGLVARPLAGEPRRTPALAWRPSSARKADYRVFGGYLAEIIANAPRPRA